MGMTIDGAIKKLSTSALIIGPEDWGEARDILISTARKYQKICKILDKSDNGEQCMYDTIQEIEEVRDGDDN